MEDTYLKHPPRPPCTVCGSVADAEVEGSNLCAEHAIEAMERDARSQVEETTATLM